jgi:hypothetical protein
MLLSLIALRIAGRVDDLKKKYPDISEEIDEISQRDPSHRNKYVDWSVKQILRGHSLNDIIPTVELFNRKQMVLKQTDINKYEDLKELEDLLKALPESKRQEKQKAKASGSTKLYEDENFLFIRINSKQACVEYGKGTIWCITMESASFYEEYSMSNVVFYFLIKKDEENEDGEKEDGEKFAYAVQRGLENEILKIEIYDEEDNKVSEIPYPEIASKINSIIQSDAPKVPSGTLVKLKKGTISEQELEELEKEHNSDEIRREIAFHKSKSGPAMFESSDGSKEWYLNGELHREDGPAFEHSDGTKEWFLNGKLHREDGPAVEWPDGSKAWYLNGKRHREDGPAVEYSDGSKSWYLNGKLHREDGPAIEHSNGSKEWYLNRKRHREDGPAVEYSDGSKSWYLNDKEISLKTKSDDPNVKKLQQLMKF